jgi:hypothetical protein
MWAARQRDLRSFNHLDSAAERGLGRALFADLDDLLSQPFQRRITFAADAGQHTNGEVGELNWWLE